MSDKIAGAGRETAARPRISAVVLAAGGSTRFGRPKQLVQYQGAPLVRRAALAALEAGASDVVVVLGARAEEISPALADLKRVSVAINESWKDGLASSLSAGIRALNPAANIDAVLVTLADQPLVGATQLRRLLFEFGEQRRVVASEYSGTVGVPAVFGAEHLPELLSLQGDRGAGEWIRERTGTVATIPLPEAELDVDTPDDERKLAGAIELYDSEGG